MNFQAAEHIIRSGDGRLRPVIDWFAVDGNPTLLMPLLLDDETRCSALYVLAELPRRRISKEILAAVCRIIPNTVEGSEERHWAEEVLPEIK